MELPQIVLQRAETNEPARGVGYVLPRDGHCHHFIKARAFTKEVLRGLDVSAAIRMLAETGILQSNPPHESCLPEPAPAPGNLCAAAPGSDGTVTGLLRVCYVGYVTYKRSFKSVGWSVFASCYMVVREQMNKTKEQSSLMATQRAGLALYPAFCRWHSRLFDAELMASCTPENCTR